MLLACGGWGRLATIHGCLGSLLVEEQGQRLVEEVLGIHPRVAKLVGGELLNASYSLLVKELHVVAGIAIKEVIGANAKPEEMNLLVQLLSMVVDIGNVGRCERAVTAQVGELVEVRKTVVQSLIAAP